MVLLFACETKWPFIGFLPVTSQIRGIADSGVAVRKRRELYAKTGTSQQTSFGERERLAARHDEVVQHLDVHQGQRVFQVAREQLVGLAGLRHAGGMVVR